MTKGRMLITGATGLVGSYFSRLPELSEYDVYCFNHVEQNAGRIGTSFTVDLEKIPGSSTEIIRYIKPDFIVNLAAMTNVDGCEIEREAADKINHQFVRVLSEYIKQNPQVFLLHVSTDYVFDGEKGDYTESSAPNPLSWYGMTKLLGERELIGTDDNSNKNSKLENWCIARTSTPFGVHTKKQTFPMFVINKLKDGQEISALSDQVTSPTYCLNLAEMLLEIVNRKVKGVIHVSGVSQISRFEQATRIATEFGLDLNLIRPALIKQMNWKAKRPANSSLNVNLALDLLTTKPSSLDEGLSKFKQELLLKSGRLD
jgi:dTDP-4-dehydrorhamnose reductase